MLMLKDEKMKKDRKRLRVKKLKFENLQKMIRNHKKSEQFDIQKKYDL